MVAQGNNVIAGCVHHRNGAVTLGAADISCTLTEVTGIYQKDFLCTCGEKLIFEFLHIGIAVDGTVDVIAVQDDSLACVIGMNDLRIGRIVIVRIGRNTEGKKHHQGKNESKDLLRFLHTGTSIYLLFQSSAL